MSARMAENENNNYVKREKITLTLSFIAYVSCFETSSNKIREKIENALVSFRSYIGDLGLIWYADHTPEMGASNNIMAFIVRDKSEPNEYYVVMRGTNPISPLTILHQGTNISDMVPWSRVPINPNDVDEVVWEDFFLTTEEEDSKKEEDLGEEEGSANKGISRFLKCTSPNSAQENDELGTKIQESLEKEKIAAGLNLSMWLLLNHLKDDNRNIWTALKDATINNPNAIFNITGHSLGGTIAYVFARYLNDHMVEDSKFLNKPLIYIYSYASVSVGNKAFADKCNNIFKDRCKRYDNPYDMFTSAYIEEHMPRIPRLYSDKRYHVSSFFPHLSPIMPMIEGMLYELPLSALYQSTIGKKYTSIGEKWYVRSKIMPFIPSFTLQMLYQHIIPYMSELSSMGIDKEKLIKLMMFMFMIHPLDDFVKFSWDIMPSFAKNFLKNVIIP